MQGAGFPFRFAFVEIFALADASLIASTTMHMLEYKIFVVGKLQENTHCDMCHIQAVKKKEGE